MSMKTSVLSCSSRARTQCFGKDGFYDLAIGWMLG